MIRRGVTGVRLAVATAFLLLAPTAQVEAVEPASTALPATPAAESEPNDTAATSSPLSDGTRIRAPLFPAGDVDYYRFSAQAGDRVFAAVVTSGSAGSSTDSQLALLGPSGVTAIESDDDNGSQAAASSSIAGATIPSDGTYILKVNDATPGTTTERPYNLYLQLRSTIPGLEAEPNGTPQTANPLGDSFVVGTSAPAGEADFYSLQLDAGDTVFLSLDLDPERDGTTFTGRLGLGLTGDAEDQILVVNDAGAVETPGPTYPSEALVMTVAETGTYYAFVDAGGAAGGGSTYGLSGTVIAAEQPSCRTYSSDLSSSFFDGGLITFPIEAEDAFRVERAAVRLELTHALMGDLDVSLRAPSGNEVGLFSDIGSASTGGQTDMEAVFDQNAAIPPVYTVLRPLMMQPESAYRLRWFEGQQAEGEWRLAVRDDNPNGSSGSLSNAELILCAKPAESARKQIFEADFEDGDDGFIHSGVQDEWERGQPATVATTTSTPVAGLSSCAQGSACFKTDLDDTYDSSSSQDLISPPISLADASGPISVAWEQWYQLESATFDHASVSVEEADGGESRSLFTWLDGTMTAVLGNLAFNPNRPAAAGWGLHRADISDFAGKTIRLRFHLDSDSDVNLAGLAIDDVHVYEPGTPPSPPDPPLGAGPPGPSGPSSPEIGTTAVLSGLSVRPRRFRAAPANPRSKNRKVPVGATIAYTDSLPAVATLYVLRARPGRRFRGQCWPPTKAMKDRPRCDRYVPFDSFTHVDVAGPNRISFRGRVGGRTLPPGKYLLNVVAQAPNSAPSRGAGTGFTVLP